MDLKEISSEVSPQLFMDILAGDRSILRKVFGRIKRFQPNKPSTKAQVAVTLASGRMTEAISAELSRLESESSARKAEIEDITLELVERGDIQRYWDKKLTEEKKRLMEVEEIYLAAVSDLGEEKTVQEKFFSEYLKEKASIDCQRQLLLSLKEEVDGVTEKLLSERSVCEKEQSELRNMHADLQNQLEGMVDTKSVLEAEKEALRILRSWVEDEARKSQARAKVLEEVGRRWPHSRFAHIKTLRFIHRPFFSTLHPSEACTSAWSASATEYHRRRRVSPSRSRWQNHHDGA